MKKLNSKHIVLSILLTASLASGSLQAQESGFSLMGIFNSAKEAFKEVNKKRTEAEKRRIDEEREEAPTLAEQNQQDSQYKDEDRFEQLIQDQKMPEDTTVKLAVTDSDPSDGLSRFFKGAVNVIKEANRKKAEADKILAEEQKRLAEQQVNSGSTFATENFRTNNSLLLVQGFSAVETKWIMYQIEKGSFQETIVVAAKKGKYSSNLSLKDGAGVYTIRIYQSSAEKADAEAFPFLKTIEVENNDARDMSFLLPTLSVQSQDSKIVNLVKQVTAGAKDKEEGIRAIHDYIVKTVKYDYDSLADGTYSSKNYDALDVLRSPLTVCAGYTVLFAAMGRAYGVRTKVIHGRAQGPRGYENHAWNEVYVNGEWKIIDSTWNATNPDKSKYFFIDANTFSIDHEIGKEMTSL